LFLYPILGGLEMRITVLRELGPGGHVLHADIVVGTERKGFSAEEILVEIDPREHLQDEEANSRKNFFLPCRHWMRLQQMGKGQL